jgi:hypothetical protein
VTLVILASVTARVLSEIGLKTQMPGTEAVMSEDLNFS